MSFVQILPAAVLWSVVVIRLIGMAYGWRPGVLRAVFLVAVAATLNIDSLYLTIDSLLGGMNWLNLVVHVLMGLGTAELSRLLLRATGRTDRSLRVIALASMVLVGVQVILLGVSNTQGSATNFTEAFGSIPSIAWYQGTFFAWISVILAFTGYECLRRDRRMESRGFRVGLNVVSAGCMTGTLAVALKILMVVDEITQSEHALQDEAHLAYRVLIGLTVMGFAIGFLLPALERVSDFWRSRTVAKDLEQLRPIVTKLAKTREHTPAFEAANQSLADEKPEAQRYRWFIFIEDVKVEDTTDLSLEDLKFVEEVGQRIAATLVPSGAHARG